MHRKETRCFGNWLCFMVNPPTLSFNAFLGKELAEVKKMFQMISFQKSMIICTRMLTNPELERNLQDPLHFFWQTPTVSTLLFPTSGHNPLREISPSLSMDFAGKSRGFLVLVDWSQTGSLGLVPATPGEDFSLGDGLQSDHPYTCTCALTHLGVHQEQDSLETS